MANNNLFDAYMRYHFKGSFIWKPLNTGYIDEHLLCVRENIVNFFLYRKNETVIMIDAGYNYPNLTEKMSWINYQCDDIKHILFTHLDPDHCGALVNNSLFLNSRIYLSEQEDKYLTGNEQRKVFSGIHSFPKITISNDKTLLYDGQIFYIDDIKIECILMPGHTIGHMAYLIDDNYLFTGDSLWLGIDGGFSFLTDFTWNNELAKKSLIKLKDFITSRNITPTIITSHTGWTDDVEFAFAHIDKSVGHFLKVKPDGQAPFDAFDELNDTKENTLKQIPLPKKNSLYDF